MIHVKDDYETIVDDVLEAIRKFIRIKAKFVG